jgi:transposase-like protein
MKVLKEKKEFQKTQNLPKNLMTDDSKIQCYEMNEKNKCYARRHKELLNRIESLEKFKKRDQKALKKVKSGPKYQKISVYNGSEDEIIRQLVLE